ncbi:MAG: hypothetical protein AB7Q27_27345 [Acidimicrobiia bacterium]
MPELLPTSDRHLHLSDDHFLVALHLEVDQLTDAADCRAPVRPEAFAPGSRWLRAGVLASIVDLVAGHVPYPTTPTLDLSLTILEPPPVRGTLRFESRAVRLRGKTAITETKVWGDDSADPFAVALTTYLVARRVLPLAPRPAVPAAVLGGSFDAFLEPVIVGPDAVRVELAPRFLNGDIVAPMHGGLQTLLAEICAAHTFGGGRPMVATSLDVRYLDAVSSGPVTARATGQRLSSGEVRATVGIFDSHNADGGEPGTYVSLTMCEVDDRSLVRGS